MNVTLYYQNVLEVLFSENTARQLFTIDGVKRWYPFAQWVMPDSEMGDSDLVICEHFFTLTNGDEKFQKTLQIRAEKMQNEFGYAHTSMSVGDIVAITREYPKGAVLATKFYLCITSGFELLADIPITSKQ